MVKRVESKQKQIANGMGVVTGLVICVGLGIIFGAIYGNVGLGIALGAAFGLTFGVGTTVEGRNKKKTQA